MAALSDRLTDLIRDSDVPFCHGASAGVKFHSKFSITPKLLSFSQSQDLVTFLSS